MDAESLSNLQDVLRCDICETPVPLLHCGPCRKNLCKTCAGEHILDESSNDHHVVRIRQKWIPNYPECSKHSNKLCEIHCEPCKINICSKCVISGDHQQHKLLDIMESFEAKRKELQDELQELEESILPTYQNIASEITDQKTVVHKNAEDLIKALIKQKDIWYREIDTIIENLQSKANNMVSGYLTNLDRQKDEVDGNILEISQSIHDLKKIVASSDILNISKFKSRNEEFRQWPSQLKIALPRFYPGPVNTERLSQYFGSVSEHSKPTEKRVQSQSLIAVV